MVKICPHFDNLPKWTSRIAYPGDWVKVLDPGQGIRGRFPGKKLVGRFYLKDEGQYIRKAAEGAEEYFAVLKDKFYECRNDIDVFETVNEPGCQMFDQVRDLGVFCVRLISIMHQEGFVVGVPAFSVCNPPLWAIRQMQSTWDATDYLTLHEYGHQAINEWDSLNYSMRHRLFAEILDQDGFKMPKTLVTEFGIDRGGEGYRHKPGQTAWRKYMDQILWYNDEIQKDQYIEGVFLFVSGAKPAWTSFDVGEAEWRDLVKRLR